MSYYTSSHEVTVDTVLADSEEIIYSDRAGGRFHVPTGSSITSITWYDAPESGGTFLPSYDEFGAAITQTVAAGQSYEIPVALAGARVLKAVGDADGTIVIILKG